MMEVIKLASPHLVLADARRDDGFPLGEFAEFLNDLLWHDPTGDVRVGKRIFFPPNLDFLPPFLETFRQVRVGTLGEKLIQVLQRKPDIGENGEVDDFVFVQLRSIDIDMNDGGFFGELRDFSCDAIIKADAEGKKQIAIVNRIVGINGAVHTEPFEGLGIIFRKAAYAHESRCDRDAGRTGKLEEIGLRS